MEMSDLEAEFGSFSRNDELELLTELDSCIPQRKTENNQFLPTDQQDNAGCRLKIEDTPLINYLENIIGETKVVSNKPIPSIGTEESQQTKLQQNEKGILSIESNEQQNEHFSKIKSEHCHHKESPLDTEHENPKQFKCTLCPKSYGHNGHLKAHVNSTHNNLKPHECKTCSKTFGAKSALKVHSNAVHKNLRPFQCKTCPRAFAANNHLKNHVNLVHHNLRPFECTACSKFFGSNSNLKSHIRLIHNKIRPLKNQP
jgi:hypothetical protein